MRARIRGAYREKQEHLHKLGYPTTKLGAVDYNKVTRLSYAAAEGTHADCKQSHARKLDLLPSRSKMNLNLRPEGQAHWVINLSNH